MSLKQASTPKATALQASMLMPLLRGEKPQPYVQQMRWTVKEAIDYNLHQKLWQDVFRRHDVFFHRFELLKNGEIRVQRASRLQVVFTFENWGKLSKQSKSTKLNQFLKSDLANGFESISKPLCRLHCIRMSTNHYEWILTSHHSLFDGRGRRILFEEFFQLLEAVKQGEHLNSPKASSFESYLSWQSQQDWGKAKLFWKHALQGIDEPTPLEIGYDKRPRPSSQGVTTVTTSLLKKDETVRCNSWSKRTGISINILSQAAWGLFLASSSGKQDVVFGAPRHCRKSSIPNAENIVGVLMNTVPVVLNPRGEERISEYLTRVQQNWKNLREHELTPYPILKQVSNVPTNSALLSSLLGYEEYQPDDLFPEDYPIANVAIKGFTEFPLSVNVRNGQHLSLEITYNNATFSRQTILQLRDSFQTIFRQLTENQEKLLRDVRLVPRKLQTQILKLGQGPKPKLPEFRIHKVFEAVAAKYPNNTALRLDGQSLSYQDLNQKANRLARLLKKDGLKPGDTVGLYFHRSIWAIISQLAVLKAGGCYVPLNPGHPMERVGRMLENSNPSVIITDSSLKDRLGEHSNKLMLIDSCQDRLARFSISNPNVAVDQNATAYIMYTSGSTGVPKGVVVPQAGVVRLVCKAGYAKLTTKTISLQLTALSFDLSVFEIWGALLNGGTCVLYPGEEPEFSRLGELIRTESINTMLLSASVFNAIIDSAPEILKGVDQLIIGAEALSSVHVARALKALPDLKIINGYGPTEATALTKCHTVSRKQRPNQSVPIGKPINYSSAYILDRDRRLLPPGVPGELYVGGIGVAAGYRGEAVQTKSKFVANPLQSQLDPVLYRTGDRAFLHSNGDFDYIERFDDQLKIRGHRIEPGEIQAAIRSLIYVRDCFVTARPNKRGELELFAFVVLKNEGQSEATSLTKDLSSKLPAYMIPDNVVFAPTLPLNSNGKVDRKALFEIDSGSSEGAKVLPQQLTKVQKTLTGIWKDLLGITPATLDSDFFESGGNSLLATSLVFKIQRAFSVGLPFSIFKKYTTVGSLANWIENNKVSSNKKPHLKPLILRRLKSKSITPLGLKWRTFCIPDILEPEKVKSLLITRAVILEGDLQPLLLQQAMEQVIQANERLRTRGIAKNGKPMEKVEASVELRFPIKDLTHLSESQALKVATAIFHKECLGNMNMLYDPQLRVQLLKIGHQKYFLSFVIQHAVADGYAVEMFYAQTSLAYNALLAKQPNPLRPSGFSYREFETQLESWLASGNEERIKRFWRTQLRGIKPIAYPFLTDDVPDDIGWNNMDHYRVPDNWRKRIHQFTQENKMTTYVFFLTVTKLLIARYTNQLDSYITSAVDGRTGSQQADIFGDFACTILVRSRLQSSRTFLQHAEEEAQKLFVAMDHKYISVNGIRAPHKKQVAHAHSPFGQLQVMEGADTGDSLQLNGVSSSFVSRRKVGALTRLGVVIRESKNHLDLTFAYAPMIFVPHSIDRLKFNFQNFIKIFLDNPAICLSQLPDLSKPSMYRSPLTKIEKRTFIFTDLSS
jgi:amino acid adenylation domain-containing protein